MLTEARSGSHNSNPPTTNHCQLRYPFLFSFFSKKKITYQRSRSGRRQEEAYAGGFSMDQNHQMQCAVYDQSNISKLEKIRLREKFDLLQYRFDISIGKLKRKQEKKTDSYKQGNSSGSTRVSSTWKKSPEGRQRRDAERPRSGGGIASRGLQRPSAPSSRRPCKEGRDRRLKSRRRKGKRKGNLAQHPNMPLLLLS